MPEGPSGASVWHGPVTSPSGGMYVAGSGLGLRSRVVAHDNRLERAGRRGSATKVARPGAERSSLGRFVSDGPQSGPPRDDVLHPILSVQEPCEGSCKLALAERLGDDGNATGSLGRQGGVTGDHQHWEPRQADHVRKPWYSGRSNLLAAAEWDMILPIIEPGALLPVRLAENRSRS